MTERPRPYRVYGIVEMTEEAILDPVMIERSIEDMGEAVRAELEKEARALRIRRAAEYAKRLKGTH